MFKNPFSNFYYCVFIWFFVLSVPVFAQSFSQSGSWTDTGSCYAGQHISQCQAACSTYPQWRLVSLDGCVQGANYCNRCQQSPQCPDGSVPLDLPAAGANAFTCVPESCPSGQDINMTGAWPEITAECVESGGGEQPQCDAGQAVDPTSGTCAPSYDDPFECTGGAAGGTAVQNSTGGYSCQVGDNYPCPAGTTPGSAFDGNGNSVNTCMADNGNSSSDSNSSSQNSSTGNDSSSGSGDDGGSGGDSSDGNQTGGSSSSASSNGSGGNGSSSSGQGGSASSAGAGQCDPTAKNYLECLNTKELEIPSEKGSYDGTGGTSTEDRIGELEGELQDVVDQIRSEINDTIGVSLSGGGTLTDQCYQIMKVQVCFGWARWSQYLSLIANAIIAMAYIASFVIIMRQ